MAYFQGGSSANYTIGGTRFWFDRLFDATSTPVKYEGFRDLGNIVASEDEQDVETLDHFTAKSGTRAEDRSLTSSVANEVLLTLDELSVQNMRSFFRGGAITDVAAASGQSVTNEIVLQLVGNEEVIIASSDEDDPQGGYGATNIVVKDITAVTTYVEGATEALGDYILGTKLGGYVTIRRTNPGAPTTIGDGDFVRITYDYDVRVVKQFAPITNLEVKGRALLFGVSKTGQNFLRSMRNVQLEPEGSFSMDSEDWSNFQLRAKILDDTEFTATAPFGLFSHFGDVNL